MALRYERLAVTVDGTLCRIVLNDPDHGNALGDIMRQELLQALLSAQEDDAVRVVVLTGAGDQFSSGVPVAEIRAMRESGAGFERMRPLLDEGRRIISLLEEFPRPVIAALNGPARAEGAAIALACDLRIATPDATFAVDFAREGMSPAWGASATLARLAGPANALDLLWTGAPLDAAQAAHRGLIQRINPDLEAEIAQLAGALGAVDPAVLHLTRMAVQSSHATDLATALDLEAEIQHRCWGDGRRRSAAQH